MKHLICTVEGGRYTIRDLGGIVRETKTIPLEKFMDSDGNVKAINPTHSKAWDALTGLFTN